MEMIRIVIIQIIFSRYFLFFFRFNQEDKFPTFIFAVAVIFVPFTVAVIMNIPSHGPQL